MTKSEFLEQLRSELASLPPTDAEERVMFYGEIIDDRVEEGVPEEQAIADLGPVKEIAVQIIGEVPLAKLLKEKVKPARRLKTWEIVLLILGSPVWFSLLVAVVAVALSLYVSLWAVIVSLWAAFGSVAASGIAGIAAGIVLLVTGKVPVGLAGIGAGLICAGLSIFTFFGCKALTSLTLKLTRKIVVSLKNGIARKGKNYE